MVNSEPRSGHFSTDAFRVNPIRVCYSWYIVYHGLHAWLFTLNPFRF